MSSSINKIIPNINSNSKKLESEINVQNTTEKSFKPPVNRELKFKPLRLSAFKDAIIEAAKEPLKTAPKYLSDDDDDEDKDVFLRDISLSNENAGDVKILTIDDNKSVEKRKLIIPKIIEPKNHKICTNKENISDGVLKNVYTTPCNIFKTCKPCVSNNRSALRPISEESKNEKQKIQCTINISDIFQTPIARNIKTPLNTLHLRRCVTSHKKPEQSVKYVDENSKLNNKIMQLLPLPGLIEEGFKKIYVNNVEYTILKELGRGGSSVVYDCYDVVTGNQRAIKSVSLKGNSSADNFINEVKLLKKLQHCDRIIKMYEYEIQNSEKLLIVMEKGDSDLAKILKNLSTGSSNLPAYWVLLYWMELLHAVKQVHDNGIIHSDLKPANFVWSQNNLKIIDFGIASSVQDDMTSVVKYVQEGSFNYISPEAINNCSSNNTDSPNFDKPKYKLSYKSDVWSLGCILYQLIYKKPPFGHIRQMWARLSKILDPQHQIEYPEVNWISQKFINTIKSCLQYDVKSRPTINALIKDSENMLL